MAKAQRLIAVKLYERLLKMAPPGVMLKLPGPDVIDSMDKSRELEAVRTFRIVDWLVHDLMQPFYRMKEMSSIAMELAERLGTIDSKNGAYLASTVLLEMAQQQTPNYVDHSHIVPLSYGAEAARAAVFGHESIQRMNVVKAVVTAATPIATALGEVFWEKVVDLLQELMSTGEVSVRMASTYDPLVTSAHVAGNEACSKRLQVMVTPSEYEQIQHRTESVSAWVRAAIREKLAETEN